MSLPFICKPINPVSVLQIPSTIRPVGPGGSVVKNPPAMQGHGFDPWVGKIPWRRKWQPTPVFLPGKSHRQRSLVGYSPRCYKMVGDDLVTKQHHQAFTKLQEAVFLFPNHPRAGTRQLEIESVPQSPLKLFKAANARPTCVSPISLNHSKDFFLRTSLGIQ